MGKIERVSTIGSDCNYCMKEATHPRTVLPTSAFNMNDTVCTTHNVPNVQGLTQAAAFSSPAIPRYYSSMVETQKPRWHDVDWYGPGPSIPPSIPLQQWLRGAKDYILDGLKLCSLLWRFLFRVYFCRQIINSRIELINPCYKVILCKLHIFKESEIWEHTWGLVSIKFNSRAAVACKKKVTIITACATISMKRIQLFVQEKSMHNDRMRTGWDGSSFINGSFSLSCSSSSALDIWWTRNCQVCLQILFLPWRTVLSKLRCMEGLITFWLSQCVRYAQKHIHTYNSRTTFTKQSIY